jgi:hypothetical protein
MHVVATPFIFTLQKKKKQLEIAVGYVDIHNDLLKECNILTFCH